ncbi:Phosphotransferase enzyme family protein [Paenibacillus sophorae]|uniref:Aminoglycoside phosphotransferase family protein n=1 Tax=Paenibacillus sophorae TaxID=1333845 RepID=A0A1H8RRM2_9BACL|nr:phosphotransferase [Paenibacillus sophorae]QWU17010.1 aminoglycoside phosphotransferase family protein [Paenibacillus sophorae]SEO69002.1 Phosphotransferase enzyme family protein [Paenibacillus sophorae]
MLYKSEDITGIVNDLHEKGIIDHTDNLIHSTTGTTEGLVYVLSVNNRPQYVLKLDLPQQNILVEQFLHTYRHSALLPKLLYTDPAKAFIVYTYISGITHYKRGSKINWLTLLVNGLINHYENYSHTDKWGFWVEDPCPTWRDFIDQDVEYARMNVGSHLPIEDYYKVKSLVGNISKGEEKERFLLHGDCGVHNFVFDQNELIGVIDPAPIVGPVLYDFIYAFCSSPDDLNLETLISAFTLLNHEPIERSRLIEEVIIQLYCRIGICIKHHPHDLADYLKAWDYWKALVP